MVFNSTAFVVVAVFVVASFIVMAVYVYYDILFLARWLSNWEYLLFVNVHYEEIKSLYYCLY